MRVGGVLALPIDVLRAIQAYTSVNKLLSCCSAGRELWPELFCWSLVGDRAMEMYRYLQSPDNPESSECGRIMSLIRYPQHYLQLDLKENEDITDVSFLGNVHTLCFSGFNSISDVSALGHMHNLVLYCCSGISDVSALGNVHTLDLTRCTGISDVSALGHVHTLTLSGCTGISDVSALVNVHDLDLSHCIGIRDVSTLGNVHTLKLTCCTSIRDVSALINVHDLDLSRCTGISDVSTLGHVHTLDLSEVAKYLGMAGFVGLFLANLFGHEDSTV